MVTDNDLQPLQISRGVRGASPKDLRWPELITMRKAASRH
jgi:hypothetical protein